MGKSLLKNEISKWIKDWFDLNGPNAPAVIGISGGVDSSVVAALCVEALGKERVKGILMPCGEQQDIQDSLDLVKHLGIDYTIVNIENKYHSFLYSGTINTLSSAYDELTHTDNPSIYSSQESNIKLALGNTQARIRMTFLYAISQMIGGRVSNNCNKSETFIGYSTRWGDDTGDFAPLRDLVKSEVVALAHELGLPAHLADKTPIDGLHNNVQEDGSYGTDEDAMGFSYVDLEAYILNGTTGVTSIDEKIAWKHKMSEFKRNPIAQFNK